jgi:hypothetical protein
MFGLTLSGPILAFLDWRYRFYVEQTCRLLRGKRVEEGQGKPKE